jgi:hypothetical protein
MEERKMHIQAGMDERQSHHEMRSMQAHADLEEMKAANKKVEKSAG